MNLVTCSRHPRLRSLLRTILIATTLFSSIRSQTANQWANQDTDAVHGVGSTLTYRFFEEALQVFNFVQKPESSLSYTAVNSHVGSCRIKDYYSYCDWDLSAEPYADFAATETSLSTEDILRWPDLLQMPVAASAVVPVYNIEGYDEDSPPLVLDQHVLVGIFSGNITHWNDTQIQALQSRYVAARLPGAPITVVVRQDVSGTTQAFKSALARFSPAFRTQIGTSNDDSWPGVENIVKQSGNAGVGAGVVLAANSIGYCGISTAIEYGLPFADFLHDTGAIIQAGVASSERAMFELGVQLDEDNTADLVGARGEFAWPVTTYTYAIIRTNSRGDRLRQGGSCDIVQQTVNLFKWFFSAPTELVDVYLKYGVVPLAKSTADDILVQISAKVRCGGELIEEESLSNINTGQLLQGNGIHNADYVSQIVFKGYKVHDPKTILDYYPNATSNHETPLEHKEAWRVVLGNQLFEQEWFLNNHYTGYDPVLDLNRETFMAMPWFLFPLAVIYNIPEEFLTVNNLAVNAFVLNKILAGNVRTWDDSHINQLNPWLADSYYDEVVTIFGLDTQEDTVAQMLIEILGDPEMFNQGQAKTTRLQSYQQIAEAVGQTPGSIAVIPHARLSLAPHVRMAHLNFHTQDVHYSVPPSTTSLTNCAKPPSYNPSSFQFTPQFSYAGNVTRCYPLALPVYLVFRYSYPNPGRACRDELSTGWQTTAFMRWLFLEGAHTEEPLEFEHSLGLMWGAEIQSHIQRVQAALQFMPCGFVEPEESNSQKLDFVVLGLLGGGILLAFGGCCVACLTARNKYKLMKQNPLYRVAVQPLLKQIHEELLPYTDGHVTNFCPAMGRVDPDAFGIALMTVSGKLYHVGDTTISFALDSMAEPLLYAYAISYNGLEMMLESIGTQPVSTSLEPGSLDPNGKPFNPLLVSGGITCAGQLPFGEGSERYDIMLKFVSELAGSELQMDTEIYYSIQGSPTHDTYLMVGQVLLDANLLPTEYDLEHGVAAYEMSRSIMLNTLELVTLAATLANEGCNPKSKLDNLEDYIVDQTFSIISSCGMSRSGRNWMAEVGIPCLWNNSGAMLGVMPGVCGIAVYSPRLSKGTLPSFRGMEVMASLSAGIGLNLKSRRDGSRSRDATRSGSRSKAASGSRGSTGSKDRRSTGQSQMST